MNKDITKKKRAEEILRESEERYRNIFDKAPISIVLLDKDGQIVDINPWHITHIGKGRTTKKDYLGKNLVTHPSIVNAGLSEAYAGVLKGEPFDLKDVYFPTTTGGTDGYFNVKGVPLFKDGKVIGAITIHEDITDRKRAEEALQKTLEESQQRKAEISALLEGSRAVLQHRKFDDAARAIFDSCKNLIGATAGYVALLSKDGIRNEVLFLDSGGRPCTVDPSLPMPIRGLREEAYRTGKAVYHNDYSKSKWVKLMPEGHVSLDNVLFAPLVIEGKAVGLLGIANKLGGFTENDARMASAFGEFAAIALLNSRTLESLEHSEERFHSAAQTAGDAIISADSHGDIIFWNKAAETMFGYSADEAIDKPLTFIMPKRFREAHQNSIKRVVSTGKSSIIGKTVEVAGLRKDGGEFPLELSLATWKTKEGIFFTGIIRDIAERKKAEEELLLLQKINNMINVGVDQEEVFKTIVDGLRSLYNYDSVAIHLLSNDRKHLIVKSYSADSKAVKRLEKLTGLTIIGYKASLYEGSMLKEIVDRRKPVITDDIALVLKSYTDRKSLQSMLKTAARLTKAKWGMGVPLMAGDKVVGIIGCGSTEKLTDADAERLAVFGAQAGLAIEKARMYGRLESAYDGLKQSNKLKDLFIDIMRHDLLNPAGVARISAIMALEDEKDPDKKKLLQMNLESTNRVIDMIESASTLAKLESGEELEVKEGDLGTILRSATEEMANFADEKKMKIKITAEGEFPALVNPLIYDVFSNLLSNAMKYGPENSNVVVRIEEDGPNWKISVADKGEGIPDEDKKAVFDRFKRIQKGAVEGTGLGLAIVKRVVKSHNGRVWVEDNPKGGNIFYVNIPKSRNREGG